MNIKYFFDLPVYRLTRDKYDEIFDKTLPPKTHLMQYRFDWQMKPILTLSWQGKITKWKYTVDAGILMK